MTEQDRPLDKLDGSREVIDGRHVLRFERRFQHTVERVWEALTQPEQISQWLAVQEVEIEVVEGGRFVARTTGPPELVETIIREAGEAALQSNDTILRVEAPYVLEHTFGSDPTSVVRWELKSDGDGCLLRHTHGAKRVPGRELASGPRRLACVAGADGEAAGRGDDAVFAGTMAGVQGRVRCEAGHRLASDPSLQACCHYY